MALMVREIVGTGAGTRAEASGVAGAVVCAWAAAAKRMMARDGIFTRVLDLGEMRAFSSSSMGKENTKCGKGWDFGNAGSRMPAGFGLRTPFSDRAGGRRARGPSAAPRLRFAFVAASLRMTEVEVVGRRRDFFRLWGLSLSSPLHPRLAPWAAFFRRFAAASRISTPWRVLGSRDEGYGTFGAYYQGSTFRVGADRVEGEGLFFLAS